jgi:DNA-binding transcriptional LysR family regulator
VLTELGRRLVARGDDFPRHVRELEEEVALRRGIGTGEVAICVDAGAEIGLLPRVLEAFVPAHSGVQVAVRSGHTETLLPVLLRGELHFLVADAEVALERDDLEIRMPAADPIAAAVRPGHPLARRRRPTPTDVAAHPFAGASTAPRFERWKDERGRRCRGRPFMPSLLCGAARAGSRGRCRT